MSLLLPLQQTCRSNKNAIDHATEFPLAADTSFYVDDCLTGANSIQAVELQQQLQVFLEFLLRKWNSNNTTVLQNISAKPHPQMLGQLPIERVTPGSVFEKVGIDYAGPVSIEYGHVRKPTIVKAYICVFVSLSVKAVHLELVTDLTSDAFIACLRRFIARRGLPNLIWSDNGTNFVGACRQLRELSDCLKTKEAQDSVSKFLTAQNVEWKFIPQHAPHFGGLWEAAVKSTKTHLRKVLGEVKLTYEEMSTVLSQIEACLNLCH